MKRIIFYHYFFCRNKCKKTPIYPTIFFAEGIWLNEHDLIFSERFYRTNKFCNLVTRFRVHLFYKYILSKFAEILKRQL